MKRRHASLRQLHQLRKGQSAGTFYKADDLKPPIFCSRPRDADMSEHEHVRVRVILLVYWCGLSGTCRTVRSGRTSTIGGCSWSTSEGLSGIGSIAWKSGMPCQMYRHAKLTY